MTIITAGRPPSQEAGVSLKESEGQGSAYAPIKHNGLRVSFVALVKIASEFLVQYKAKRTAPAKQETPRVRIAISSPMGVVHVSGNLGQSVLDKAIPLSEYSPETPVESAPKKSFGPVYTAFLIDDNPLNAASPCPSETAVDDANAIFVPPRLNGEADPHAPGFGSTVRPLPEVESESEFEEEPAYATVGRNSSFDVTLKRSGIESDAKTISFKSANKDENDEDEEPVYTIVNKANPHVLVRKTAKEIKSAALATPESPRDADANRRLATAVNTELPALNYLQQYELRSKVISAALANFRADKAAQAKNTKKALAASNKPVNSKKTSLFSFNGIFGFHKKPDRQAPALPASSPPEQIAASPIEDTVQNGIFDTQVFDTAAKVVSPVLIVREQYDAKVKIAKNHVAKNRVAKERAGLTEQFTKLQNESAARFESFGARIAARIGGEG